MKQQECLLVCLDFIDRNNVIKRLNLFSTSRPWISPGNIRVMFNINVVTVLPDDGFAGHLHVYSGH